MLNKTEPTILSWWWNYTYNLPRSVLFTFSAFPQHLKLKFHPLKFIHKAQFFQFWTRQNWRLFSYYLNINRLTPNDSYSYMSRTAPLTSKHCILYIYSTNTGTEYFKHALYSPFFSSSKWSLFHNANLFGSCIIQILYTGCAKIKKIIPALKC